jgi:hypothetical protein
MMRGFISNATEKPSGCVSAKLEVAPRLTLSGEKVKPEATWALYAILPPPFLVMTTTDGRGGIPALKSGQRVAGFSKVESLSNPG